MIGGGNLIHIVDGQNDMILDDITQDHIISDSHKKSLEDTLETYEFITFADKNYSKYLTKLNRVIIPDEDGTLRELVIQIAENYRDSEGQKKQVLAYASYLLLAKEKVITPTTKTNQTASMIAGWALADTEWSVGIVESNATRSFTIENYTNPYAFLKTIANEFNLELRFRVVHNNYCIVGRYVDLLERIGTYRGREITFGRDLDSIRRIENNENIVTALHCLGPEREDGTRLEIVVDDQDALQRWGRPDANGNLKHLIEVYEPESERSEMTESELRQYGRTELNKRINSVITYECSIVDLEKLYGDNEKIYFGDTIRIKDEKFNPPLYLEARVFEVNRSIKKSEDKTIKLGDYIEYSEAEVKSIWLQLKKEIQKKVSAAELRAYAEPKKIESDTPPIIKDGENPIWVKTDGEIKTPHVVIGGEWVPMTPSEEIIQDASRLKNGIINVNQVPLRTSITGARIEWDGVNGLVQYDANGNPIAWFDLEGNARFSGDISGSSGTFGNVTVNEGDITIKDANSNTEALLTPLPNLLGDPGFEGVLYGPEDMTYNWADFVNPAFAPYDWNIHKPYWLKSRNPKVAIKADMGPSDYRALPIFGQTAVVVNGTNYVYQDVADGLGAGGTYTLSGYFRKQWGQNPGKPQIVVGHRRNTSSVSILANVAFNTVPINYDIVRYAITFTIPTTYDATSDYIRVQINGADNNWVQVDGVQLVRGVLPTVYNPDYDDQKATEWGNQATIWTGALYPLDSHTITPKIPLSQCNFGWLLKWQGYNSDTGIANSDHQYSIIPKTHAYNLGTGMGFILARGTVAVHKYLYVTDTTLTGHAINGTGDNALLVLSEVLAI